MSDNFNWVSPSYAEQPRYPEPPDGTTQIFRIMKAEPRLTKTSRKPTISLFGDLPEWEGNRWNGTIWLPVHDGDDEKYRKDLARFFTVLRAFDVPDPKGKGAPELCAMLKGCYAQAKVKKNEFGIEGRWFKELTDEQKKRYSPDGSAGGGAPAGQVAEDDDPNPFG